MRSFISGGPARQISQPILAGYELQLLGIETLSSHVYWGPASADGAPLVKELAPTDKLAPNRACEESTY